SSSDAIALWGAWSDLGLKSKLPMVASFHGGMTDYFIGRALSESNPKAAEAMIGTFAPVMYMPDIQSPENVEFVKKWTEGHNGEAPEGTNLTGATYQAFLLLKTAIESNNGVTTPDELIKAIFAADITGPEGHLFFEEGQHAATKDVYIGQVVKLADGSFNYKIVKTYKDVPPTGMPAAK
ncbi:MAG: transporter substrate-binding protein, partial [Clostridiales bacterium]|nr:transporter substrate-binding protein [Clostridiales bacterium]